VAEMERRGRRDRHLRRRLGARPHETEMLDHRMAVDAAELALEAQQDRPRLRALELELALARVAFDPVERQQEVVLPGRAAVLAVGDRAQPNGLLLADDLLDLAVLDHLQRGSVDLAALALLAGGMERGRAQQTADVIGAERRRGALHNFFFPSPS